MTVCHYSLLLVADGTGDGTGTHLPLSSEFWARMEHEQWARSEEQGAIIKGGALRNRKTAENCGNYKSRDFTSSAYIVSRNPARPLPVNVSAHPQWRWPHSSSYIRWCQWGLKGGLTVPKYCWFVVILSLTTYIQVEQKYVMIIDSAMSRVHTILPCTAFTLE